MDSKRSTTNGFFAALAVLIVVLVAFFFLVTANPSDNPIHLGNGDGSPQGSIAGKNRPSSAYPQEDGFGSAGSDLQGGSSESQGGGDSSFPINPGLSNRGRHTDPYLGGTSGESGDRGANMTPSVVGSDGAETNDPRVQKAIDLVDQGKVPEALKVLEDVLSQDPKNEQALVEMAMIHILDMKQPDAALGYLQRVVDVNPTNQVVLNELVSLYQDQGRTEEGLNFLMDLAERKPGSSDVQYSIGQMLKISGRQQDALSYMEKAAQSPVHQTRAYRDLAETYMQLGDTDKSIEFYDKAIASQEKEIAERTAAGTPVSYSAERLGYMKSDKARVLLQKGDVDGAQAIVNELHNQLPNDPNVAQLMELIRMRKAG